MVGQKQILSPDEEEGLFLSQPVFEEVGVHDFKQLVGQKQILPPDEEEGCVLQVIANNSPDQVSAAPSSEKVQGMLWYDCRNGMSLHC